MTDHETAAGVGERHAAPGEFCQRHWSWLCQAGQGQCGPFADPTPAASADPAPEGGLRSDLAALCDGWERMGSLAPEAWQILDAVRELIAAHPAPETAEHPEGRGVGAGESGAGEREVAPCWRAECQRGCYYPTACSEQRAAEPSATPDADDASEPQWMRTGPEVERLLEQERADLLRAEAASTDAELPTCCNGDENGTCCPGPATPDADDASTWMRTGPEVEKLLEQERADLRREEDAVGTTASGALTEAEQRENRIAMWKAEALDPTREEEFTPLAALLDSLEADCRAAGESAAATRARAEGAAAEREAWSSWLDGWLGAVGPKPPTVDDVARALRSGPRPFGCAKGSES